MIKKIAILVLIMLIVISITACGGDKKEEPYEEIPVDAMLDNVAYRNTILYFEDENGYIVPTMKQIKWEEGIGRATLENLKSDAQNNIALGSKGLVPILAMDSNIKLSITDGVATCDLSAGSLDAKSQLSERNKVDAVVNTLCEFDTINSVQITIEGETVENLEYGTYIGTALQPNDINIEVMGDASVGADSMIKLFFENPNTSVIVPITRQVTAEISEFTVMSELLRGPRENSGLENLFPEGTKLLDISVEDGVLIVNLSKEAKDLKKTPEKEKVVMMILLKTFEQFDNIDNVRILIEGKEYLDSAKETMMTMTYINIIE